MISVQFQQRDFSSDLIMPRLDFKVRRYSNHAYGGPRDCEIIVTGPDLYIWECMELLRCPIYLRDDNGALVWWGFVTEVLVTARNPFSEASTRTRVGASFESMFNRVAVAWEDITVGTYAGPRYTTDWTDDDTSQSEYGIKEGLFSGESASDSQLAVQARDILLQRHKYPIPLVEIDAEGESSAVLRCQGWWTTLAWRYANVPTQLALGYTSSATIYDYAFGTTTKEKVAQAIDVTGGDITVAEIKIYLSKTGNPTDNVTVSIYDNPDDLNPTTLLGSGSSVAGASLTTDLTQTTFTISYTLTNATSYFLVVERSGAADDANYYNIGTDSFAGYPLGPFVYYDSANWVADPTVDVFFEIYANAVVETSTQVLSLLTTYGQFFTSIEIDVSSGVTSESYRDGDGNAQYEIEQLMGHGTTLLVRMLSYVDEGRGVLIYSEPLNLESNTYSIFSDGSMLDNFGAPVRKELAKAGVWARLVDVIPPSVDTTFLGNAMVRFIEITEYDVENNRMIYIARDEIDPFEIGRPYDG